MNLYIVSQNYQGWDTYTSVLVSAESEEQALELACDKIYCNPQVQLIGKTTKEFNKVNPDLIHSFHAG